MSVENGKGRSARELREQALLGGFRELGHEGIEEQS